MNDDFGGFGLTEEEQQWLTVADVLVEITYLPMNYFYGMTTVQLLLLLKTPGLNLHTDRMDVETADHHRFLNEAIIRSRQTEDSKDW